MTTSERLNKTHTASRGKLKIVAGGYSCAGLKKINEDSLAIDSPQKPSLSTKGIVATIADGVSHAKHAASASQYCTTEFSKAYYNSPKTWSTQRIISDVLNKINNSLYRKQKDHENTLSNSEKSQWLTTFSGIVFRSATVHIFHVGDTQIARIRNHKFEILTTPHNQKLANHAAVLTRAFGADNHLQVDYHQFEVKVGDLYLLTTDGVHEHITREDFVKYHQKNSNLNKLSRQYVDLAETNQSQDNLSCLLVKVESVPNLQPDEIRKTLTQRVVPPALEEGQTLEGYKVIRIIHSSSRSHLYLVEENTTGKRYTLKAPSANFSDDEIYLQGFIREAWVGSQINHPAIMKVYPGKADAKFLYHICEYINGQTLRQWMYDHPVPNLDAVRKIVEQITIALRIFKNLDIVHRDVKPDNIMIAQNGQVKLIDYGTASVAALEEQINRLSETHPLGTVNYIAPETMINLSSNFKSDLFSLGVITYEMLTGKLPYPKSKNHNNQNTQKGYHRWQYQSALDFRNDLPFWLDLTLRKSVEADPKSRYGLYSEFMADLSKPNLSAENNFKNRPFIERDPVKFWKLISGGLSLMVMYLLLK